MQTGQVRARIDCACILAALALGAAGPAFASENGLGHYPTGVNTVLDGVLPPPGSLQFYNYSEYYDATALIGTNGAKLVPDFHADIKVDAPRLVYTYPVTLGPFHLSSGVIPTLEDERLTIDGRKSHVTGVSDIDVEPLYLSWANKHHTFLAYVGADIWVPTGSYNKASLANLGRHYWTFGPDFFMTWFPDKRVEISNAFVAEINTKNGATEYHSGSAVNVDSSVHYRLLDNVPKLRVAVQGYYHQQFTNDTVNGVAVLNGFRGRSFAIGPQIEYDIVPHGGLLFKVDREFDVENRPRGTKYWIEFAVPIT